MYDTTINYLLQNYHCDVIAFFRMQPGNDISTLKFDIRSFFYPNLAVFPDEKL